MSGQQLRSVQPHLPVQAVSPPLLLVATKINIDMTHRAFDSHNTETAVNNRWEDRFRTVLLDAVLNWDNVDWFKNWSAPGVSFKDTYPSTKL